MSNLLKDIYNKKLVTTLSTEISIIYPDFNKKEFVNNVFNETWEDKELKQRIRHISEAMKQALPDDYVKSIEILKPVSLKFSDLEHMIFPDFVEFYGIDDLTTSIDAMEFFTERSSSEFPVRFFIIKYKDKMMRQMNIWSKSKNEHVRRLASEGCRPRLPWAIALPEFKKDPAKILPILERLKSDKSEYVRRSVANNLNDISKDNPEIVIEIAKKWLGLSSDTDKLVKHACRTLLKSGNVQVLKLFGFKPPTHVTYENFKLTKKVTMGESLEFSCNILSDKNKLGKLRIEYAIYFIRLNNKISRKIFKISEGDYKSKQLKITKKHSFREISTRKYYTGKHSVSIIVNGKVLIKSDFRIDI